MVTLPGLVDAMRDASARPMPFCFADNHAVRCRPDNGHLGNVR